MKKLIILCLLLPCYSLFAQKKAPAKPKETKEEVELTATVTAFFKALHEYDTTAMRAMFHPSARMQSALHNPKTGETKLITEKIDSFLINLRVLKNDGLNIEERITGYEMKMDFPLAQVWTPYRFYVNGNPAHSGVDAFHFFREGDVWKIIQICDTRRK